MAETRINFSSELVESIKVDRATAEGLWIFTKIPNWNSGKIWNCSAKCNRWINLNPASLIILCLTTNCRTLESFAFMSHSFSYSVSTTSQRPPFYVPWALRLSQLKECKFPKMSSIFSRNSKLNLLKQLQVLKKRNKSVAKTDSDVEECNDEWFKNSAKF